MNRAIAALGAGFAVVIALVAIVIGGPAASAAPGYTAAAATATGTATATASATATRAPATSAPASSAAPTSAPGPRVNAQLCAALSVDGVRLLGTDADLAALLTATVQLGPDATAGRIADVRRQLGCTGNPATGGDVTVSVCALLGTDNLGGLLDQTGLEGTVKAVLDAARPNLPRITSDAFRTICSPADDDDPTDTPTASPLPTDSTDTPDLPTVPRPIGAPETGGQ